MEKQIVTINTNHICPMVTGVTPHVGGVIVGPGCPSVLIDGIPVSLLGDTCICVGPPDAIVQGHPGVMIDGIPVTVQNSMTAHGGVIPVGVVGVSIISGSSPITVNHTSPKKNKLLAFLSGNSLKEATTNHKELQKQAVEEEPMIFNVHWEEEDVKIGEGRMRHKVTVAADTAGFKDGESVTFTISPKQIDPDCETQPQEVELQGTVSGNRVTAEWTVEF